MRYNPDDPRRARADAADNRRGLDRRSVRRHSCVHPVAQAAARKASPQRPRGDRLPAHPLRAERACRSAHMFYGRGRLRSLHPSAGLAAAGRGEFLTAYTPYQAEIMQGELQAAYEYQTMLCELLAMDIANTSMYDGGSALAESAVMARDLTRRDRVVVSRAVHPEYRQVLRTYTEPLEIEIVEIPHEDGITPVHAVGRVLNDQTAAVIIQHPNFFGCLEDAKGDWRSGTRGGRAVCAGDGGPPCVRIAHSAGRAGRRRRGRRRPSVG